MTDKRQEKRRLFINAAKTAYLEAKQMSTILFLILLSEFFLAVGILPAPALRN
jgi:hypothetical protein